MNRFLHTALALVVCVSAAACSQPMQTVHVDKLQLDYASPLVASKDPTPVFIVLDPARVPKRTVIREHGLKPIPVENVDAFVTQHLATALSTIYASVNVVPPGKPLPSTPHLVASVSVDKLGAVVDKVADAQGRFAGGRAFGTMTWSFAWRPNDSDEFTFTHSQKVRGTKGLIRVEETHAMVGSTFNQAVEGLMTALKAHRESNR